MEELVRRMEANIHFRYLPENRKHNAGFVILVLKTAAKYGSRSATVRIVKDWRGRLYYKAGVENIVGGVYKRVYIRRK